MIFLKDIVVAYSKDYNALMNINLEVKKGQRLGILGPSGCGKTTLFRLIAGLDFQKTGEAYIKDTPIKKIDFSTDVNLGYLTNTAVFFERKTVYQNLEWVLKVHKIDKEEYESRINKVLSDFEISHLKNEKVRSLCKSDRRLVQIARIALRPLEILLCDDIVSSGDSVTQEKIKKAILKLFSMQSKDTIILFASENEEICKQFVDKILRMDSGSFVESKNEE